MCLKGVRRCVRNSFHAWEKVRETHKRVFACCEAWPSRMEEDCKTVKTRPVLSPEHHADGASAPWEDIEPLFIVLLAVCLAFSSRSDMIPTRACALHRIPWISKINNFWRHFKFCKFLPGSFSAVSKQHFARKYAFDRNCQALQDVHTSTLLQTQHFSKKSV